MWLSEQKPVFALIEFNFNFIASLQTLNIYPSPVYQMLNVNWSAFLKGILSNLQRQLEQDTIGTMTPMEDIS